MVRKKDAADGDLLEFDPGQHERVTEMNKGVF